MQPLYVKIVRDICGKVDRGELKRGQKLPSDKELQAEYQVSRDTIRAAKIVLRAERMIVARSGIGTFVADPSNDAPAAVELTSTSFT